MEIDAKEKEMMQEFLYSIQQPLGYHRLSFGPGINFMIWACLLQYRGTIGLARISVIQLWDYRMRTFIDQFDEHDRPGSWRALSSVATAFCFWRGLADSYFKFVKW
ncbi:hypothetical protein Hdeb2414_s0010g00345811 [Helianthus debilis subsp. tardiflorus]